MSAEADSPLYGRQDRPAGLLSVPIPFGLALCLVCRRGWRDPGALAEASAHTRATGHPSAYRVPPVDGAAEPAGQRGRADR